MGTSLQKLLQEILTIPENRVILAAKRKAVFAQIHEIVFYGKGGYDFDTVYNMPIWLRNYIYHEMVEAYRAEAEAAEGKQKTVNKAEKPQVNQQVMNKLRKQTNFSIQKPR